jgi:hypothetical protein
MAKTNYPISCRGLAKRAEQCYQPEPMGTARYTWTALQTDYQSEGLAARSLRSVVTEAYNPLFRERSRGGVRRVLPVLQGYILARLDRRVSSMLGEAARAKGVKRIVGEVRVEEIEWLRSLEGSDGYVVLEGEEPPAFAFGESVLALSGAFREQTGEYRGVDQSNPRRANIAFEILSRVIVSSVPRYDLARI